MGKGLKRLVAIGIGLLLCLGALEIILRFTDAAPLQRNPLMGFHVPHARLGWSGVKGYSARIRDEDYDVVIQHSESGFRAPGHGLEVLETRPRIAVLGDSFTWGWGVAQGEVFTDHLQLLLGERFEVLNFGVSAYGTGQQLLLFEELVDIDPAFVLVLFYDNDIVDNESDRGGERPWFRMEGDDLVRMNIPVRRELPVGWRALTRRSFALSTLRYNVNRLGERWKSARGSTAVAADSSSPNPLESEGAWRIERAILAEMKALCRVRGAALRIARVGSKEESSAPPGSTNASATRLADICEELSIPFVDLAVGFRSQASNDELFFRKDFHWTAPGHRLVAELLHAEWFGDR